MPVVDLTGRRFGRLLVGGPSRLHKYGNWRRAWLCKCDCGNEKTYITTQLTRSRSVQSCGCLQKEAAKNNLTTHGKSGSLEHQIWRAMKQRCCNPRSGAWRYYGGRGIRVCARWDASFAAFLIDVGPRPSSDHSIDRIDVNGHYEPGNVRWATSKQQGENTRKTLRVEFDGRSVTISDLAAEHGINAHTLYERLFLKGWPLSKALSATKFKTGPKPGATWKQRSRRDGSPPAVE